MLLIGGQVTVTEIFENLRQWSDLQHFWKE